ncbi:MAG TPA: dihydrodipicolinate synthase family protein [Beijerinckiaceae bacterium]|jgi:4-hydroxy-tetrahydrodipicolinate synthase|nr:dihydrodipicolinate synthase family protein [Beijerinckiaceae bacterium]
MTRLNEQATGVYVIAATPFTDTGALDFDSIDRLVEFYLSCGVAGITILGMMGEAAKLSSEESDQALRRFLAQVNGRVPVVVGVSNPGTGPLVRLAHEAMALGAAGVMIAPLPSHQTEEQLHNYFFATCNALGADVPIVLQDYPVATTAYMSVATIEKLIDALPQLVMLKHEDSPGHNKLSRLRRNAEQNQHRRVSILVGNGGLYLPQELARGADGAMTGFAYPEMLVDVCALYAQGKSEAGEDLFDAYLPLLRHEAQISLGMALRKEVLRRRGAIASAFVRAPGPSLTRDDHAELDRLIARLERRTGRPQLQAS